MRLICPNCGAQYAVADDVIPPAGRDVQCSNCAHTWFETPGASENDGAPTRRSERPAPSNTGGGDTVAPAPQAGGARKTVDPAVADILREEAARETAKRRAEQPVAMESQSDLGLAEPARTKARPIETHGKPDASVVARTAAAATGAVAAPRAATGRERLPDIDDVKPTIGANRKSRPISTAMVPPDDAQGRKGFRRGFFLMLVIIAILAALYVQAEAVKAAVPAVSGALDSYVAAIDSARLWFDDTVRGFLMSVADEPAT